MEGEKTSQTPSIEPGDEVLIRYRVLAGKEVVDAANEPLSIKVGEGKFMPAVERALIGHRPGEVLAVMVPPEEHYGRYDPKKLQVVPLERIPQGVSPGTVIKLQDEYGVVHPAVLKKVEEGLAVVDFNHPLAGKVLTFEVEILDLKKKNKAPQENPEEALAQEGRSEG